MPFQILTLLLIIGLNAHAQMPPQNPSCMQDTMDTDSKMISSCFTVYPNPFHEQTMLTGNDVLTDYFIILYDHNGMAVRSLMPAPHSTSLTINRENLEAGVYYLKIISPHEETTLKLVIE